MAPNGHADPIERCPLLGPKQKTSARSEYFSFLTQGGSGRAARLLMNCAQTAQRRRRDVKKRTNRSRHVSRGRNNEMNGPRRGLEFAQ
jgi:hypothetical protein